MIELSFLQLDQTSLLVMLISLLGLARERTVLPFLIAIIGSFLLGDVGACAIAAAVLLARYEKTPFNWVTFKDGVSFVMFVVASVMAEPYREFLIFFGVIGLSIHDDPLPLGIVPALLLSHAYFGSEIPIEYVFSGAGAYILVVEGLRFARSKHEKKAAFFVQFAAMIAVLFPLYGWVLNWSEDQVLLYVAVGVTLFLISLVTWSLFKKPSFEKIYETFCQKMNLAIEKFSSLNRNELPWVRHEEGDLHAEVASSELRFDSLFLGVLILVAGWLLMLVVLGGLS